jgi:hypothetical protein
MWRAALAPSKVVRIAPTHRSQVGGVHVLHRVTLEMYDGWTGCLVSIPSTDHRDGGDGRTGQVETIAVVEDNASPEHPMRRRPGRWLPSHPTVKIPR